MKNRNKIADLNIAMLLQVFLDDPEAVALRYRTESGGLCHYIDDYIGMRRLADELKKPDGLYPIMDDQDLEYTASTTIVVVGLVDS